MRRLCLFALLLALPAGLWAAQFRAPEARLPVQLSLPLEGPAALPAGPALTPPSAAPAAGLTTPPEISAVGGNPAPSAAAVAVPAPAAMPEPVARALKAGDAHAFYKAVAATGYDLPRGDDHQERLLREGAERAAADRAFFDGQRSHPGDFGYVTEKSAPASRPKAAAAKPIVKKRPTKLDYAEFGRLLALTPRLSESPFRDTEAKRRILIAAGYTHLIGPGGKRIPLSIADEARVGRAFQHTLETYRRRQR